MIGETIIGIGLRRFAERFRIPIALIVVIGIGVLLLERELLAFPASLTPRLSPTSLYVVGSILCVIGIAAVGYGGYRYWSGWPLEWRWTEFIHVMPPDLKTGALMIAGVEPHAKNPSGTEVRIDEAYISGRNGQRIPLTLNDPYKGYQSLQDIGPIPSDGEADGRALFRSETQALTEQEFWNHWSVIEFYARYAGREYRKRFDTESLRSQLDRRRTPPQTSRNPSKL